MGVIMDDLPPGQAPCFPVAVVNGATAVAASEISVVILATWPQPVMGFCGAAGRELAALLF